MVASVVKLHYLSSKGYLVYQLYILLHLKICLLIQNPQPFILLTKHHQESAGYLQWVKAQLPLIFLISTQLPLINFGNWGVLVMHPCHINLVCNSTKTKSSNICIWNYIHVLCHQTSFSLWANFYLAIAPKGDWHLPQ